MIQVNISRNGQITNSGTFPSQEEADAWLAYHNFSGDIEILDITAKLEQEAINAAALQFLAETDWQVTRAVERGEPVPAELREQRDAARNSIVK